MTILTCLSVPSSRLPMAVLELLTCPARELPAALAAARQVPGVDQVLLLSTCERTELYALCEDDCDTTTLLGAFAEHRGVPVGALHRRVSTLTGEDAVRHLLRVASGLESFVMGESDIVGQVRRAVQVAREEGTIGLELERLVDAAVNTSRRVHRSTGFGLGARSVAAAAVQAAAVTVPGGLAGRDVVVVGAGQVASSALASARQRGARITVCNRSRGHGVRLAPTGVEVRGLDGLEDAVARADVVVFGTSAPQRLLLAGSLRTARERLGSEAELLVVDLCVPRNVDPEVRGLPGVTLLDLNDLRNAPQPVDEPGSGDVELAGRIVAEEVDRFLRWWSGRTASAPVRRLREDVEACVRIEVQRATRGLPADLEALVAQGIRRAVRHLAHQPTRRLIDAAAAGDDALVEALAGMFAPPD